MALSSTYTRRVLAAALAAAERAGAIHRRNFRAADLRVELKSDASPVTRSDRQAEEAIREELARRVPELGFLGEEFAAEGNQQQRWIIDPLDGTKNFVAGLPYYAVLIALEIDGISELGVVHAPSLGLDGWEAGAEGSARGAGVTWWAVRERGAFCGRGTRVEELGATRLRVSATEKVERAFLLHGGLRRILEHGLWEPFSRTVARVSRTRGFGDWWGHMLVAEGRADAMFEAAVALHDVAAVKVIVEEAGGTFLTRGNAPLIDTFNEAVLSANRTLAGELAKMLGL